MNVGDYSRGRDQGGDIKGQEMPWHIAGCPTISRQPDWSYKGNEAGEEPHCAL